VQAQSRAAIAPVDLPVALKVREQLAHIKDDWQMSSFFLDIYHSKALTRYHFLFKGTGLQNDRGVSSGINLMLFL
jgi:hypothetical protein